MAARSVFDGIFTKTVPYRILQEMHYQSLNQTVLFLERYDDQSTDYENIAPMKAVHTHYRESVAGVTREAGQQACS